MYSYYVKKKLSGSFNEPVDIFQLVDLHNITYSTLECINNDDSLTIFCYPKYICIFFCQYYNSCLIEIYKAA